MDSIIRIGGAVLGAGSGVACALALSGPIRSRGAWLFWLAAVVSFVVGVAAVAMGIALGIEALVWGGSAFALATVTALKWKTGRVPGVPVERTREPESGPEARS